MKKLNFPLSTKSKSDIANLHMAFKLVKLPVAEDEVRKKQLGNSTKNAIKGFQKNHDLSVDGELNDATLSILNNELFDNYHVVSKTRTKKLHELLERLDIPVAAEEKKSRKLGEKTRDAIKSFQKCDCVGGSRGN